MKINWKLSLAIMLHRRRCDRRYAQSLDPRPCRGGLEAVVAGRFSSRRGESALINLGWRRRCATVQRARGIGYSL